MTGLYRGRGLSAYEGAHYSHGEHVEEVEAILAWYRAAGGRLLDLGCSAGLHALEFARRGFSTVGVDVEPSAIRLAKRRAAGEGLAVEFRVLDLGRDSLAPLGRFTLVYSLGNVLSHIPKAGLGDVLAGVRGIVASEGVFLFDALSIEPDVPAEIEERGTNVRWTRTLSRATGEITLEGEFRDQGLRQRFHLWGYTAQEMCRALERAGFSRVEVSRRLDFERSGAREVSACLKYRAT